MKIPFFHHGLGKAEREALSRALDQVILTTGDVVSAFEQQFAEYLGAPHAVGVTSCTAALHLALLALGVRAGDEVITTPMTFVATATAILQAGARPVFVDVDPLTGNMDPGNIEAAISPRTKVILPVHLYGRMCDMRVLRAIADRYGLAIVEDAAHCLEGERDGVRPGMLSEAACFSFYATKSITSGEGGALVTRDRARAESVRLLRQQGMTSGAAERERLGYRHRDMVAMGWKYNMYNLQAALLLPQLERVEASHLQRARLASRYLEAMCSVPGIALPRPEPGLRHAWHLLAIQVEALARDEVVAGLQQAGVGVAVHYYPPVHLTSYFRQTFGYADGSFPHAEELASRVISLPLYAAMPESHVQIVAERLHRVMESLAA